MCGGPWGIASKDGHRLTFVPLTSRSQICPDRHGAAHHRRTMTAEPLSDEALLARLVAFDTTSHKSNREIADFISDYLDRPGVRIIRHPTPDGAKLNLIVAAGPEDGDHGLVLWPPRWIAEREGKPLDEDGSLTMEHPLADLDWAVWHLPQ